MLCTRHTRPDPTLVRNLLRTYPVYVLTKGGLSAVGQVPLDDEMPQSAPDKDDGQVQQDEKLEVVGAALHSVDKGALGTSLIDRSISCSSC